MKKAFLLEFSVITRVIADVPDDYIPNVGTETDELVAEIGVSKINADPYGYVIHDNLVNIQEDTELPYDEKYDH